ncbi:hypothetical protein CISIN_1g0355122mg, partial [Citrus sinensis]
KIPPEIGNLRNLEELNLGDNKLVGTIPTAIFNVSKLKALKLYSNSLLGSLSSIPDFRLPNLEVLLLWDLENNSFSGFIPNTLGNLRNLERLNLGDNYLTSSTPELSFLSSLSNFKSLTHIVLSNNPLDGILPKTFF